MAKRRKKKARKQPETDQTKSGSELEIIEKVKVAFLEQLNKGTIKLKVGDILKIFEIQKKLSTDENAEEKFWELIEQIRQTELEEDQK